MKRLMILMALSILSEILVSCGASTKPSTPYISPSKAPTASVPRPSATPRKLSPTASVPRPSATPRKLSPTASVPRPSATPRKLSPTATTESNLFSLPVSSDVPPGDVLAQIAYGGKGGGEELGYNMLKEDDGFTLKGLAPYQRIRVLAYKYTHEGCGSLGISMYLTEWDVTLDENGYYRAYVNGNLEDIDFLAFDADSGKEILSLSELTYMDMNPVCQEAACPGAPPQRMLITEPGYVCTQSDSVKLRDAPSRSGNEIIRLPPGTNFHVIEGPSCSDNWSWWRIRTDDGTVGWIAEGGDNTDPYFICPAQ